MMAGSTGVHTTDPSRPLVETVGDTTDLSDYDIPATVFSFLMEIISYGIIVVALFGMIGNILIIITFTKMGFSESINISYCALCISDIFCVAAYTWIAICFIPAFNDLDLAFIPGEVVIVTGGALGVIFSKTTAWITTFISIERCLCVMLPLNVKDIFRSRRTMFIIITIFAVTTLPVTSFTFYYYMFTSKFDSKRNITVIGVGHRTSSLAEALFDVNRIYKLVFMTSMPLVIVSVCSVSMVVHLSRSATWRLQQSGMISQDTADNKAMRKYLKDIRVAKTVLAIATCFIVLETLGVLKLLVFTTRQDFRPMGAYGRSVKFISSLAFLFSLTNSSVNFVIYYNMGSRFRQTVRRMLVFSAYTSSTKT